MIYRLLAVVSVLCLVVALRPNTVRAEQLTAKQLQLEKSLRQLEEEIGKVRELKFKKPVVAKIIPRPASAPKGIQGYYSIKDKAIFVYDDISGAYERGVLIHEMVHALQDQHFGLAKLHQGSFGTDAELAMAALIEGDATFTMIELLKKAQPRVAMMLDMPLAKARNLQNAFLYGQGARYVKALKERGGWKSVNFAYRFSPRTTAAILHPKGVSAIDLGPGKKLGEWGLIQKLAAHPKTKPLAVEAAAGWQGDRLVEHGNSKVWIISFAKPSQAHRFHQALAALTSAQNTDHKPLSTEKNKMVWQSPKGHVVAALARGNRVFLIDTPDEKSVQSLLDRYEGPPDLTIFATKDKQYLSFGQMVDRLMDVDIVCVGESHDSELHHRIQYQVIKALYARDERLGVGMEMFQKPFQPILDRYFKGELTERQFLKQSEYQQRWGYAWSLYRPISEFCKKNGLPLAALNVPRELTRRISMVGFDKLNTDEKKQLGTIDFQVKEHRTYWYERLAKMHGNAKVPAEQKERSYQVMTAWDDFMGATAAEFQKARSLRRMVILAGSGHVDRWFGIPHRAAKRTGGKVATVHIKIGADPKKDLSEMIADFIIFVK